MQDVIDVAEYMLNYCDETRGIPITNLQLQKFLYYVQGVTLVLQDRPMFINDIEAWRYGPVIPDAYFWFNDNQSNKIKNITVTNDVLSSIEKRIINFVADHLIKLKTWELVERTHLESPWRDNYMEGYNQIISNTEIKEWFKNNWSGRVGED